MATRACRAAGAPGNDAGLACRLGALDIGEFIHTWRTSEELSLKDFGKRIGMTADETPPPQVSRVLGVLDTLSFGSKTRVLRLDDGRQLRGGVGALPFDELEAFLGTRVVIEGATTFRPSGEPLRIEVDFATPADIGTPVAQQLGVPLEVEV